MGVAARGEPGGRARLPHRQSGWRGWLVCSVLAGLTVACGRSSGSKVESNYIPQPTPDRTMDAVVRGLGSPVVFGSPEPTPLARPARSPVPAAAAPTAGAVRVANPPSLPTAARAMSARSGGPGAAVAITATPPPSGAQEAAPNARGSGPPSVPPTPRPAPPAPPLPPAPPTAQATPRPTTPPLINPTNAAPALRAAPTRPAGGTPQRP